MQTKKPGRSRCYFLILSISDTPTPSPQFVNKKKKKTTKTAQKFPPLCRLGRLTSLRNALQQLFTVLVHVELGDDDLRGGDTERNALAVRLLADNTLDVDNPLETVDAGDLALTALVGATDNGDLVVLADGDGTDLVSNC